MPTANAARNAVYAQSGGVTAVINASACGVIETARKHRDAHRQASTPGATASSASLTEDLIDVGAESRATIRALRHTPAGRLRLGALQAQGAGAEPRRIRAPDRGVSRPRHRLLLLQRRQRFDGHRATRCAQIGAQLGYPIACIGVPKTVDNDLPHTDCCPGFGSVAKYIAVSTLEGALDVRLDGAHLDQGVRARGDGPARRLDRRRRRTGRAQGRRCAAHHPVSGDRVRREAVPRARQAVRRRLRLLHRSSSPKARTTPMASSSPRPAPRTPSATRSSAAWRRSSPTWCARRTATSSTGPWPTTCSAPRATSPRRSTSSRPTPSARRAVEYAAAGQQRRDADDQARVSKPYRWKIVPVPLESTWPTSRRSCRAISSPRTASASPTACRRYLEPLIGGEDYPPYRNGLPVYARLRGKTVRRKLKGEYSLKK